MQIFLDESLQRFETVWPAAGSPNAVIRVNLEELQTFSGTRAWVKVTKNA